MMIYDYVSVLAGGQCSQKCSFCVGQYIREVGEKPHFADFSTIKDFLKINDGLTDKLSISGSSSDPLLVSNFEEVLDEAKNHGYSISLHTCHKKKLINLEENILDSFYRIVISLHGLPNEELKSFIKKHEDKVRISAVYFEKNKEIIDSMEFFNQTPAKSFTIRKNVFNPIEPELKDAKLVGKIHKQPVYEYEDKKIAVWDFPDANKHTKANYLWPDNRIKEQCYWQTLYL